MLHLLTEEHRKKVVSEYKKRVMIVFLGGVLSVLGISAILLAPTFFMSHGRYDEVLMKKQSLDTETSIKADDSLTLGIRDMIASVEALHSFDSRKDLVNMLASIVQHKPSGILLKTFILSPADDTSVTIDIGGVAPTRTSLVTFTENLKSDHTFSQVLVPLSSFAKEKDIQFSMKLMVSSTTKTYEH